MFDDTTLDIVLETMDTISDFMAYLNKKEALLNAGKLGIAMGEEELLANYLSNVNEVEDHDFSPPPPGYTLSFGEGLWQEFCARPERVRQLKANEVSYVWDDIIERFGQNAIAATLYFTSHPGIAHIDKALGFMAREGRTRRRALSIALLTLIEKTTSFRNARLVGPSYPGDPYYVFVLLAPRSDKSNEEYRLARQHLLVAYCHAVKLIFADAIDIVGIATETAGEHGRSEDVIYLDGRDWTPDDYAFAEQERKRLNIFKEHKATFTVTDEYPT